MSEYLLEPKSTLTEIANAIREKTGSTESMTVSQMASLIGDIETGGGTPMVGTHKVALGQFTPQEVGDEFVNVGVTMTKVYYVAIWLDDITVKEKYASSTIMVASSRFISNSNALIHYYSNGSEMKETKLVFGIQNANIITIYSHANWQLQPETYNYMVIYD